MNHGRFFIPMHIIRGNPDEVMLIMQHMVVTRAEMRCDRDGIEYSAMSDFFEYVPEGCVVPFYTFEMFTTSIGERFLNAAVRIEEKYTPQF